MNRAIMWLAGNSVAANLLMVLIVVSGLMAAATISVEVFPEVELDRISIRVPYLGAAPRRSSPASSSASKSRFRTSTASRRSYRPLRRAAHRLSSSWSWAPTRSRCSMK